MRKYPVLLAAFASSFLVSMPVHDATAEDASSRLVPGGWLQPRRLVPMEPPAQTEMAAPPAAAAPALPPAAAQAAKPAPPKPVHRASPPRQQPVGTAPRPDGKIQF